MLKVIITLNRSEVSQIQPLCVCSYVHIQAHKTKKSALKKVFNSGSRDVALPNDPVQFPACQVARNFLYQQLHGIQCPLQVSMTTCTSMAYIHTDNMQLLRMRKRRKKKQLLSPNSRESCAYEMHKLCFHRRSVSQGDGFSLPCCSLIAVLMLLSSPKFSSKQFRNVTTEGGKYLISWLRTLITELSPLFLVHQLTSKRLIDNGSILD